MTRCNRFKIVRLKLGQVDFLFKGTPSNRQQRWVIKVNNNNDNDDNALLSLSFYFIFIIC